MAADIVKDAVFSYDCDSTDFTFGILRRTSFNLKCI